MRQVVDGLQTLARDRGVEIEVERRPSALLVLGDRDELMRVFENLVENALKYGASGKRVDIALSRGATADGKRGCVAVRDYGPGIAPEHLPRLTERFYRVDVRREPRAGRHRPRPGAGQAHPQPPSRPVDHRERAWRRRDLCGSPVHHPSAEPIKLRTFKQLDCHPIVI